MKVFTDLKFDLLLNRNIILLLGKEKEQKEEAVSFLANKIITSDFLHDFNYSMFRGGENTLSQVLDTANTLPMMGEKRLIIVYDFDKMENAKDILDLYPKTSDTTLLVLVSSEEDYYRVLDKGFQKRFETQYPQKGEVKTFYAMNESALRQWLKELFLEKGKNISHEAASLMISLAGENMSDLISESLKVSLFVGARKEITIDDIRKVLSSDMDTSKEKIIISAAKKEMFSCLKHYNNFNSRYKENKHFLALLGELSRYFRNLLRASYMKNKLHQSRMEIEKSKRFNLKTFEVKDNFFDALEKQSLADLKRASTLFYTMDRYMKSERDEHSRIYFERLLIALSKTNVRKQRTSSY